MSLDYELRIATDLSEQKISELLLNKLHLDRGENNRLFNPGIVLGVFTESECGQSLTLKYFGFKPTVDIWFRLNPNKNYEQGKHTLLQATMVLLSNLPGDAVLLFNYESIVFQRISDTLIFNRELGTWSKSELDNEVKQKFYWEPLPSPLLSDKPPKIEVGSGVHTRLKATSLRQGKSITQLANEAIEAYLNSV